MSIRTRLEVLERRTPGALTGKFTHMETGETKTAPLREVTKDFTSWRLDHVVSGNRLADLDSYLGAFREAVNT